MYIQWSVKGIAGTNSSGDPDAVTKNNAFSMASSGAGIQSNWWRNRREISPQEIAAILTEHNLDLHLHDYANYGKNTPFISLACGCVGRDALLNRNITYFARDTALIFATDYWARPGALFYCWTLVGLNPAVEIDSVAEPVRDLNVYRRWSPYQLEGEVTAKIHIPANQISHVEWWDGSQFVDKPVDTFSNPGFVDPAPITNVRGLF